MILERSLPVLLDSFDDAYMESYSAGGGQAFRFFDRRGCLVPNALQTGPKTMIDQEQLRSLLRAMAIDG